MKRSAARPKLRQRKIPIRIQNDAPEPRKLTVVSPAFARRPFRIPSEPNTSEINTVTTEDGTAIGNGLATAVARLKDSDAKSKVVILLTDGMNNSGEVAPLMAAEIAKTYDIRVYTIGVGAMGEAPYPFMTPWGVQIQNVKVEIDEDLLKQIATETGGKYFRATNNTKLMEIYSEINQMEKTRTTVDSFPVYSELFMRFALIALLALLAELLLRFVILRRIP